MTIPGPAYKIITPRLVMRCADPMDTEALYNAIQQSLDNLQPWMRWAKFEPVSVQERLEYLRKARGNFDLGLNFEYLIFDRSESTLLGAIGYHLRSVRDVRGIGYWIQKDHLNQGFATEATAALTRIAFELDHVKRVEIWCDPQNVRSASVPRKLGFIHEATLHNRIADATDILKDMMVWALFEDGYAGSPAARLELQAYDAIGRPLL